MCVLEGRRKQSINQTFSLLAYNTVSGGIGDMAIRMAGRYGMETGGFVPGVMEVMGLSGNGRLKGSIFHGYLGTTGSG